MRTDRLEHLITILEGVPPDRFDLENWTCGSAACACGWAALDPEFIKQGFRIRDDIPTLRVEHEIIKSWDAVQVFFELAPEQAYHLFSDEEYGGHYPEDGENDYIPSGATAADVIARIHALIGSQP